MALLGIDVGTSELKAALFDLGGECLASASSEYQPAFPAPGRAELDPDLLWRMVVSAIRRVVAAAQGHRVQAVSLSVHGESFVALGTDGKPVCPIILNIDGRAAAEMHEFAAAFGREALYRSTGLPPHPMYTLPKVAWLKDHAGSTFASASRFYCVHDYLLFRATGDAWIDTSLASRTLGYDITRATWDEGLLAHAGLKPENMARVAAAGTAAGRSRQEVATETGLPPDAVWVTGGHDQACTSIGSGGLHSGTVVDGTGTFECMSVAGTQPLPPTAVRFNFPCERHAVPDYFLALAYAPGGVVLKWFRDQFGRDVLAEQGGAENSYARLLAGMGDEPTGLFVLPYLFGTGTPWLDPAATGVIHGFTFATSREALLRAALEGVTYEMRWNLEALRQLGFPADRVVAVGGGAKSAAWLQLKADIFGCEVTAIPGEAACRGAAICAGVGCGSFISFSEGIPAMVRAGAVFHPRSAAQRRYTELFQQYQGLAKRLYGFELPASGTQTYALGS